MARAGCFGPRFSVPERLPDGPIFPPLVAP
jgi:hypothetical protein